MKSLPVYYALVVAGYGHAVPRDAEPFVPPTFAQRLRAFIAGFRPLRPAALGRRHPA